MIFALIKSPQRNINKNHLYLCPKPYLYLYNQLKFKTMKLLFTLCAGAVIGLIDALPMFLKKMDRTACWSAFLQYVVVTFIIFNTTLPQLGLNDLFTGPVVALLTAIPIVVLIGKSDKKAIPIVLGNALILGFIISVIKHFCAPLLFA